MNRRRSSKQSPVLGGRSSGISSTVDENNNNIMDDLFSHNPPTLSLASSDDSHVSAIQLGAAKQARNGLDDLLSSSNDSGKHDYDWLLSPPGTPIFPSLDGSASLAASVAPRINSLAGPVSTIKASRLSVSQSECNHRSRPSRSSSVSRSSISSTQFSTYSNKSTSIFNTSSSSISSYIRPSTPTTRSSSTTRPSSPSLRSTRSQSSTPSKSSATPVSSRPSTPSYRSQTHSNLNSSAMRSASRPSTPTRRNPPPSLSNGRRSAPLARPISPCPRVQTPPQPIVLPDFPLDTPPNLRTTLPERPLSAGRSRPGAVVTLKVKAETPSPVNLPRRQSSPAVTRGRLIEPSGRTRIHANRQVDKLESRKASHILESSMRKPVKTSSESMGFGRNISKKSLDMAIRHMDIRNGSNWPLTGSTVFPQSIRLVNQNKSQPGRASSSPGSVDGNLPTTNNGFISENGNYINRSPENGSVEDKQDHHPDSAKLTKVDIYESARYDAILQKEDLKNTTWLHSADDNKSDQGPFFDNGFEPLPEPFDPL
ncbi:hypothetical protein LguiA_031998 [Lonicera macranthoides]